MTPGNIFNMFHFCFCSPIFNNIPSHCKFWFDIKMQKTGKQIPVTFFDWVLAALEGFPEHLPNYHHLAVVLLENLSQS